MVKSADLGAIPVRGLWVRVFAVRIGIFRRPIVILRRSIKVKTC
jgi:hypothetical protein